MQIKSAVFKLSTNELSGCPKNEIPEYAFIGRSNVGKSSLINMLCNRNELARTSATPGKTISMNYFLINDTWFLVDLPGYGYAKRSKSLRNQWENKLQAYLNSRENLVNVFVLVDSRIPPQQSDIDFINKLGQKAVPFSVVFTKLDKLKQEEAEQNIDKFKNTLLEYWEELPVMFYTSSVSKTGRDELLKYIDECNQSFFKALKQIH
ncbi:MAG: ribosome biogenesis GTP-binding protein YihA/YsxC [Bacteroidia bacterium]